jgi:ParB-like chromosome segregation protein Spo0J
VEAVQAAQLMSVGELVTRPPFSDLFVIDRSTRDMVAASVKAEGFRDHEPIEAWDGPEGPVVIDGHTRLSAAKEARIGTVPVVLLSFFDESAALLYAARKQRERRNLTDGEIYEVFKRIDRKKTDGPGRPHVNSPDGPITSGPSREETADQLGVSTATIRRMRSILAYESGTGDTTIVDSLKAGEMSISRAELESRERNRAHKSIEQESPKSPNGDAPKVDRVAKMLSDSQTSALNNIQVAQRAGVSEGTVRAARKRIGQERTTGNGPDVAPREFEVQIDKPPANGRKPKSIAIDQGYAAINCLTRIPVNDTNRKRGLQIVSDWIRHHS